MTTAPQAVNNSPVVTVSTTVSETYKRSDFIKVDQYILHATEVNGIKLTGNMKLVYMAMLSYQRDNKKVFYTMEKIAVMCGITDRSAKTLVQTMTDAGLINEVQRRARKANVYNLNEYVIQEAVRSEQNASHPTAKRKPKLSIVESEEQPNDADLYNGGDDVQSCDPLPVIADVIDSVQPKEEKATNDSVLPVDGSDNDRSDEVITVDVKDDLDLYTQIADNFGVKYNLPEIMHMCRGDRVKAAKRLKGEIDTFHFNAKQSEQQPAQLVIDGDFDYDLDEETADEAGYAF
ncbi:hypothetical protein [Hafnia paralvei]|uniref:Helix-turn-helix domain-containing protein n=1 Tax=Salmonella enterica I TaxID=59201 RepID=A0A5Y3M7L0_SALET|nr:hypothetical protein [Salmonella enterica subsp. enterica]